MIVLLQTKMYEWLFLKEKTKTKLYFILIGWRGGALLKQILYRELYIGPK